MVEDFEFVNKLKADNPVKPFVEAIEEGVKESLQGGAFAGYQIINVKISLVDGSYHEVDSSEMAYKIAASQALRDGVLKAGPVLMEPVMKVEVEIPDNYLGDVIGDLNSRRGRIEGIEPIEGTTIQMIKALAPLSEMFGYATCIRSLTQGRGTFSMEFAMYEPVPETITSNMGFVTIPA